MVLVNTQGFSLNPVVFFLVTCLVGPCNVPVVGMIGVVRICNLIPIVNVTQVVLRFQEEKMTAWNTVPVLEAT